ncbi:hypothetical protein [Cyclobacterium qasimii]|uniref:Uncharacterized protein n=1 Tax=Cyclobacterium qasimii M12-11B TaxID=641524 RepID=S7WSK5_9BACT|nr:hypothetical protein [Cyclobacterium qasimii]EPR67098.1 hypothetical protein ADICYQ_3968 [Cyclobacterium qasimii M12-11B]
MERFPMDILVTDGPQFLWEANKLLTWLGVLLNLLFTVDLVLANI